MAVALAGAHLPAAADTPPPPPPRPKEARPGAVTGQVTLPSGRVLAVEVAETPLARQKGYMFREKVTDQEGMVFLFDQIDFHSFWMKNCRVSLDIIWLDELWKVVHLEASVPPCRKDPCPSYTPMQSALYVLEVQAGLAAREGVKVGDHIIFKRQSSQP